MGFLKPKVVVPPPPPPPPPPPAVPDPVVRAPANVADAVKDNMTGDKAKSKANLKTNVQTSSQGVIEDAPLDYSSLLGQASKTKKPGDR